MRALAAAAMIALARFWSAPAIVGLDFLAIGSEQRLDVDEQVGMVRIGHIYCHLAACPSAEFGNAQKGLQQDGRCQESQQLSLPVVGIERVHGSAR